jgi:hypothetical protein
VTKRFDSRPREERTALIEAKEAQFRERLARALEAVGSAQTLPPSPCDHAIRQTGKEHPWARVVRAPAGMFDSVRQASEAFAISRSYASRLARERRRGWSYVDGI